MIICELPATLQFVTELSGAFAGTCSRQNASSLRRQLPHKQASLTRAMRLRYKLPCLLFLLRIIKHLFHSETLTLILQTYQTFENFVVDKLHYQPDINSHVRLLSDVSGGYYNIYKQ